MNPYRIRYLIMSTKKTASRVMRVSCSLLCMAALLNYMNIEASQLQQATQKKAPQIETERVILRQWKEDDKKHLHQLLEDPEVNKFLEVLGKNSPEKVETFVTKATNNIAQNGYGYFACQHKESGEFMGWAGLNYIDWIEGGPFPCYTISGIMAPKYWSHGYATEVGQALLKLGFEQHNMSEIHACAVAANSNSEKAMKRIGLKHKEDFDFPGIAKEHPHARNVLYVITKEAYEKKMSSEK